MGPGRPRHGADTGEGAESCMGCPEKVLLWNCFYCLNPFSSRDMSYRERGRSVLAFVAAFCSSWSFTFVDLSWKKQCCTDICSRRGPGTIIQVFSLDGRTLLSLLLLLEGPSLSLSPTINSFHGVLSQQISTLLV